MADRRLQVFHTVARLLSFTRAAESLQMTQPAVTFQIRQLEEQLQARLFDRSHNRITMTEAGNRAFEYAERIFGLYGEMESSIRQVTGEVSGILRICAGSAAAQYVLPPLLTAFQQQFPDVRIELDVASSCDIGVMVDNSFVDIGILDDLRPHKKLLCQPYSEEEWVFVVAKNHPLANTNKVTKAALNKEPWILANETAFSREIVMQHLKSMGVDIEDLNIMMSLGSPDLIKHAVEANQGVTILPRLAVEKEIRLGTLAIVALEKPLVKQLGFIYKEQKFPLRVLDELLALAKKMNLRIGARAATEETA